MRTCITCKNTKPDEEFALNNQKRGWRSSVCKKCHVDYCRELYNRSPKRRGTAIRGKQRRKAERCEQLIQYLLDHPCVDCGESNLLFLDFDHVGPKKSPISRLLSNGQNWDSILAELSQCEVRCVKCHRQRHAYEHGWRKLLTRRLTGGFNAKSSSGETVTILEYTNNTGHIELETTTRDKIQRLGDEQYMSSASGELFTLARTVFRINLQKEA